MGLIRKAGLHFAPLYMGAEDREFEDRLFTFVKPVMTESKVTHPGWHSIFVDFERSLRYRINEMLLGIPAHMDGYLYGFAVMSLAYILFGTGSTRKGGILTIYCMLAHRYGLESTKGWEAEAAKPEPDFERIVTPLPAPDDGVHFHYKYGGLRIGHLVELGASVFRKKTLLKPVNTYAALISVIMAKETWVAARKGDYLLAENRNTALHMMKILSFCFLFFPFLAFGIMTFVLNCMRKPKTVGYGL